MELDITKEDIAKVKLDEQILVKKFRHFVYDGVNKGKNSSSIAINNVVRNLCNSTFNKSTIMIDLFNSLSSGQTLETDFLGRLEGYLENKEKERKRELTQKIFKDMPASTMEYLENVTRIHQFLIKQQKNLSKKDIKVLSLLLGIQFSSDEELKQFFNGIKLSNSNILDRLGIRSNSSINQEPIDIDILYQEYGEFIFAGHNKDLSRNNITINSIANNIFNKDINNSVIISKLLGNFNLSYDSFQNFTDFYNEFIENNKKQQRENEKTNLLDKYSNEGRKYIENVARIHKRIHEQIKGGKYNSEIIRSVDDIEELSLLLGLFINSNNSVRFLNKSNINLENILEFCSLDKGILGNLTEAVDTDIILDSYKKYISYSGYNYDRNIDEIAKQLFDQSINRSFIIEQITSHFGYDYNILKEEIENGQEHIFVLSNKDRIEIISNLPVEDVDLSSMQSILEFGNILSPHSQYIHSEFNHLELSNTHESSVATIKDILDRMYDKPPLPPKPKGIIARLFGSASEQTNVEPKLVLNSEAIAELRDAINSNINTLSTELLGYDFIKEYIELYRRKNRTHYMKAEEASSELAKKLEGLNPEDDEMFSAFLDTSSKLKIMNDKVNRFGTSNYLMKQELVKVNQAEVNHFITINALEIARDDLIPLIGSELAIARGKESENRALDLSNNVVGLFEAILSRNIEGTVENIQKLKQSTLSEETYRLINRDIKTYLENLSGLGKIEGHIEDFEIDGQRRTEMPINEDIILSLENTFSDEENTGGDIPKVKRI